MDQKHIGKLRTFPVKPITFSTVTQLQRYSNDFLSCVLNEVILRENRFYKDLIPFLKH